MDVKITKVGDGRLRKFVGGRWFNLSRDERFAKIQVAALINEWARLKLCGATDWPEEAKADSAAFLDRLVPLTVPTARPVETIPASQTSLPAASVTGLKPAPDSRFDGLMLHEAMGQYVEHVKSRYKANQIGDDHFFHQAERMEAIKAVIPDQLLMGIGYEQLMGFKQKYTSRPPSKRTDGPISIAHVVNTIQALHMAFEWFDRTDRWEAPRHFADCLTVSGQLRKAMMSPAEKKKARILKPTFTLDELRILWQCAWPGARLYMLMGLSLGWTQKEIATLRKDDLVEKDGELFIDKLRNKTGVPGYRWVFPELATELRKRVPTTPANADNLAFLTSNGLPLVHRSRALKQRRTDAVALVWAKLMKHARARGVRPFGFSRLRKTGAQMIENLSSLELAKVFMAHAATTVAETHYITRGGNPEIGKTQFAKLETVLRQLRHELEPMFSSIDPVAQAA